jgi:hypothetical protein
MKAVKAGLHKPDFFPASPQNFFLPRYSRLAPGFLTLHLVLFRYPGITPYLLVFYAPV